MAESSPIDERSFSLLTQHALNGAQRQADGSAHYSENLRYGYLTGKDRVSFAEATGVRHVVESGAGRTRLEANPAANAGT